VPDPDDVQALSAGAGLRPSEGKESAGDEPVRSHVGLAFRYPTFYHPRILGRTVPHFHVTCSKFAYKKWIFCSCGSQAQISHILFRILTFYSLLTGCRMDRIWETVGLRGTTTRNSEKGFSSLPFDNLDSLVYLITY
jgi:hypothetical protein